MPAPTRRTSTTKIDPDRVEEPRERKAPWEDEDQEEPRPRRRAASDHRDEESSQYEEESGDEEQDGEETQIPISIGRSAIKSSRSSDGSSMYFKWDAVDEGEDQVVKFLDTDPWSYSQHWVTRKGRQSFPCIGSGCPLCAIGAKVSQKIVYTLLNLSASGGPTVQVLEVTTTVDDDLVSYDSGKSGPLPRLYWSLSRTKKSNPTGYAKWNYNFSPVKERDLEEDYGIDPDSVDAALDKAEVPEPKQVLGKITSRVLSEIAEELVEK